MRGEARKCSGRAPARPWLCGAPQTSTADQEVGRYIRRRTFAHGQPAVLAATAILSLIGCRPQPSAPEEVATALERGPLKLTVAASPKSPVVGDVITVRVTFSAPAEYVAALPSAEDFGDLGARLLESPDPSPGPQDVRWQRTFALEPLVSGPLEIPPLVVRYGRKTAPTDTQPALDSELASNTLKIEVRSALTDQDQPAQPRDITGTVLPPKPPWPWWLKLTVAAGTLAAIGGVYLLYRAWRRWKARPPPPILPEVWALRELSQLEHWDWLDAASIRVYYYRLTETVRRYIELKFGLAAPEMTTEEFLATLARDGQTLPYDTARLRAFLEACDYVKYAALQPAREDGEHVLHTARAFVQATAAAEDSPPFQGGGGGGSSQSGATTPPQRLPDAGGNSGGENP